MPISIHPILNKVVVKREEVRDITEGGIVIPETAKKKALVGDVIAIGPDVEYIEVGDKVLFDQYSGTNIIVNKIEYLVIIDKDIFTILQEEEPDEPPVSSMGQGEEENGGATMDAPEPE